MIYIVNFRSSRPQISAGETRGTGYHSSSPSNESLHRLEIQDTDLRISAQVLSQGNAYSGFYEGRRGNKSLKVQPWHAPVPELRKRRQYDFHTKFDLHSLR